MFLLQASPHMAKFFRRPGRKTEVLVSQQAATFCVCVSNALMHSIKILFSDMGWGEIQASRDLHETAPSKSLHCFAFLTLSHICSQLLSHTIPGPQPTYKTGWRSPHVLIVRLTKKFKKRSYSKATTSAGAALPLATLPLFFSQTKKQANTRLSPGHQTKQPRSLGYPPCSGLFPLPLLPFLLHIAHVSHQMSHQSLQQRHLLTSAREKAARIQSCNLLIICNELMGKYFCLIRIFSYLLITMSGIWLALSFVPAIIAGQLLVYCMYLLPSAQQEEVYSLFPFCATPWNSKREILLVLIYQP